VRGDRDGLPLWLPPGGVGDDARARQDGDVNKEVPANTAGLPSALRDEIETLGREVYGDGFETLW